MAASAACMWRSSKTSASPVDGDELNRMVEQKLGPGWERMIRETSRYGNEQTLIFVHPEGTRMGLFIVDLDGNEMDVVAGLRRSRPPEREHWPVRAFPSRHGKRHRHFRLIGTSNESIRQRTRCSEAVRGTKLSICAAFAPG